MANHVKELSIAEGRRVAKRYPLGADTRCESEVKTGGRFYVCTRHRGHDGQHVAHIPGPTAVATWEEVARG